MTLTTTISQTTEQDTIKLLIDLNIKNDLWESLRQKKIFPIIFPMKIYIE